MGDARFSGLYMVLPPVAITMLFVFVLQFIIRLWMVNSPRHVRKYVRFPLNEDLTEFIMSKMEKPVLQQYRYVPHGYPAQPPDYRQQGYSNQGYQGRQQYQDTQYQASQGYQNKAYLSR